MWNLADVVHALEEHLPRDLAREIVDLDEELGHFTVDEHVSQAQPVLQVTRERARERRLRVYAAVFKHTNMPAQLQLEEVRVE